MKVALFEQPHRLTVTTKDLHPLNADEILVKVRACGVCGTDVHIVDGTSRSTPPVVLGHEYAGMIVDVGRAVHRVKPGDHVAVNPNISCGMCYFCCRGEVHLCANLRALGVDIDGGMAEFCLVPERQAYALPVDMSPERSAFVEPVSCAIHGIERANIRVGDTVVIIGAGTIGLIMLQLARNAGAARTIVIEPLDHKRLLAVDLGADIVVDQGDENPRDAVFDNTGVGADVVIECAGNIAAAELAIDLARRGGTIELFGVCPTGETARIEPNKVYFRELTIVGSFINPHTFSRAIDVLQTGRVRVDRFQINKFSLDEVHDALRYQREGKTIKSILIPNP